MAKKGRKRMAHFAHIQGADCNHGYEEAVHLLAKEVFRETKILCPPQFVLKRVYNRDNGEIKEKIYIENSKRKRADDYEIQDEEIITLMRKLVLFTIPAGRNDAKSPIIFDEVKIEQRRGDIIPDAIGIKQGDELFVEFWNTHEVNDEKFDKIRESGFACVEIDLSKFELKNDRNIDFKAMKDYLASSTNTRWIYYPRAIGKIKDELYRRRTASPRIKPPKPQMPSSSSRGSSFRIPRLIGKEYEKFMDYTDNLDHILDKVNDTLDDNVCEYVRWLRTLNGNPWPCQELLESNRTECRNCIYGEIKFGKVFCQRY